MPTQTRAIAAPEMTSEELARQINALDIVLCHDYLTQSGGAERVVLELARILRPRETLVSLYAPNATFAGFKSYVVRPSYLNRQSLFRKDARAALPFLARSWSTRRPVRADIVFCSSSGWAHAQPTAPGVPKIVYCHNPARWLYQPEDYLQDQPWYVRLALKALRPHLLRWDRKAAASADLYLANSSSVAERIRQFYGIEAKVIFPPVSIDTSGDLEPVPGMVPPFYLTVARGRGYKGGQQLIEAFRELPDRHLVVVGDKGRKNLPSNVQSTGFVSDAQLRWLYSKATALVSVSREDFGLTPVEANAFGTPSLLLRAGGFLDSTIEGVNGMFIDNASTDAICKAVRAFPLDWDREAIKRHAQRFGPEAFREAIYREVVALKEKKGSHQMENAVR